ncbi:MAG: hypothetical protein JRI73_10415, partial [Deltaproteobacteria bacterium]|nr:hypothetical protein [Deltaproteobacteria bacterium]
RYWARGRADQDLPFGMVARVDADFVSDQDYLREFEEKLFGFATRTNLADESKRPFQEKRSPTRRSALRLDHDGESYSLQGITGYWQPVGNPADNKTTEQPLGGLSFTLLPEQFMELPIFFTNRRSAIHTTPSGMTTMKETASTSISRSMKPGPGWLPMPREFMIFSGLMPKS